jgi:hypothetical protein
VAQDDEATSNKVVRQEDRIRELESQLDRKTPEWTWMRH